MDVKIIQEENLAGSVKRDGVLAPSGVVMVSVQGPKGDKGDTGAVGPKGEKGDSGITDYNELQNTPIKNVVGTADNPVIIRNPDSGSYVFSGRFTPYMDAPSTMYFSSNLLVNVKKSADASQVQIFYPNNNCVQYLNITDTTYERKTIYFNDLALTSAIPTDDHINELISTALGVIENGSY